MNKYILVSVIAILSIIFLAGCFFGGYYLGNNAGSKIGFEKGKEQGFKEGQKAAQDIIDAANPYTELENVANPFQEEYENPF